MPGAQGGAAGMVEPSQPGILLCMRCHWLFVSPDAKRIRRCQDCKHGENGYSPRCAEVKEMHGAMRDSGLPKSLI